MSARNDELMGLALQSQFSFRSALFLAVGTFFFFFFFGYHNQFLIVPHLCHYLVCKFVKLLRYDSVGSFLYLLTVKKKKKKEKNSEDIYILCLVFSQTVVSRTKTKTKKQEKGKGSKYSLFYFGTSFS